jgi:response regulator RpfG family c-di-GMP phosphodiesterase
MIMHFSGKFHSLGKAAFPDVYEMVRGTPYLASALELVSATSILLRRMSESMMNSCCLSSGNGMIGKKDELQDGELKPSLLREQNYVQGS